MQELFGIYCTDGVARDNSSFAVSALEDMVWMGSEGRPLGISHDFHRFIGWNVITGLYMSHEMSYVVGSSFLPEDKDEYQKLNDLRSGFFHRLMSELIGKYREDFTRELESHSLLNDKGRWFHTGAVMYGYHDILHSAFPFIKSMQDGDQMVRLEDLLKEFTYQGQGVFAHKKSLLTVFLHPYFRRSYSRYNNYNFGFLDLLFEVYNSGNKSVKVLLDPDFIGYAPSYIPCHEYEYWYGPLYNDDISSIPEGLQHLENDECDKLFNNVKCTEFVWQKKDDGKKYQFEMEEVVDADLPALPDDNYACRYLHSFYDFEKQEFNHFDGAIRIYDLEKMLDRIDTPMDKMGHQAQYQKIFRMDGNIPLSLWKGLITQYLCSNNLIYDYFGIERPFSKIEKQPLPKKESMEKYVPYVIGNGDGVRLLFSYRNEEVKTDVPRCFDVVDKGRLLDGKESKIAQFSIVEVFKALNRVGAQIELPRDIAFCSPHDHYHYIPCIQHGYGDIFKSLNETMDGIKLLIQQHVKRVDDDVYSFSLSWNVEGKTATLAFMGHVVDMNAWLQNVNSIPTERAELKRWLEEQNKYVHTYGRDSENPNGSFHIKSDGVLFFQRHDIKEHVTIKDIKPDEDGMYGSIEVANDEFLADLFKTGKIHMAAKCLVTDAIDMKTGTSYLMSPNSALFDETTYKVEGVLVGFNWALNPEELCVG